MFSIDTFQSVISLTTETALIKGDIAIEPNYYEEVTQHKNILQSHGSEIYTFNATMI